MAERFIGYLEKWKGKGDTTNTGALLRNSTESGCDLINKRQLMKLLRLY